jgi:serine protease
MPADVPGNLLSTALEINVSTNVQVFTDTIHSSQLSDFYKFGLQGRSSLYLSLNRFKGDLNFELIKDANSDGVADSSEVIAFSDSSVRRRKTISTDLDSGTYYIRVYSNGDTESFYNLSVSGTPESDAILPTPISAERARNIPISSGASNNISSPTVPTTGSSAAPASPTASSWKVGTLSADTFTYDGSSLTTYFTGNGDIDFGSGKRDVLDFKTAGINSSQVSFNWATSTGGGVVANPGNGARLFDAVTINAGNYANYRVLFEGIEQIQFSDRTFDLATEVPGAASSFKGTIVTNDTLFNQQTNLFASGIPNAWRFTTGNSNVLIGIADSGLAVDASGNVHSDLRYTIVSGDNYQDESDTTSHGTSVQSTIAAVANNGTGIAGINWASDVEHIDVLGGNANDRDLATATQILISHAKQKNQKVVVNLSLSGGDTQAFIDLVAQNSTNVLFVAAAGNGNSGAIPNPGALAATYNNVVSVGASWGNTDWYSNRKTPGQRVDYSQRNPELTAQNQPQQNYTEWWGSSYVDPTAFNAGRRPLTLMALNEYPAASADKNSNGAFAFGYNNKFNGTSASTAVVSGVASLVWSANPNLTAAQVKNILAQTAVDLGATGYDQYYGHGFVNADAAVRTALAIARG